jgi:hypothetical protein
VYDDNAKSRRFLGVPVRRHFGVQLRVQLCAHVRVLRPERHELLVLPRCGALSSITVFVIPAQAWESSELKKLLIINYKSIKHCYSRLRGNDKQLRCLSKKRYPVLFHTLFLQNPPGFCHSRVGGNRVYFIETWKLTREFIDMSYEFRVNRY